MLTPEKRKQLDKIFWTPTEAQIEPDVESRIAKLRQVAEESKKDIITVQGRQIRRSTGQPVEGEFGPTETIKPEKQPIEKIQDIGRGILGGAKELGTGIAQGAARTLSGASSLGQRGLESTVGKLFGQKPAEKTAGQMVQEQIKPETTLEKIGFGAEQLGEFFVPSGQVAKLGKGAGLLKRAAIEAATFGGITAAQKGEVGEEAKTSAMIAAAFPIVGKTIGLTGKLTKKVGEKIQRSVIRPNLKDLKDGFKIENVNKYDVGGSIGETLTKANAKMNELGNQLSKVLKSSDEKIDLNEIFRRTKDKISGSKKFGEIQSSKRVINSLGKEIKEYSDDGIVDLFSANKVKRDSGTKGAWTFGSADPDRNAVENVYTTFYNEMKKEIERKFPKGVIANINRQISELIPISNAALRRIPVEERNNLLSLTDSIGLFSAVFDPKALALVAGGRLSKSGKFGAFLAKLGQKIEQPKGILGQRFIAGKGELITEQEKKALEKLPVGLSVKDIIKDPETKEAVAQSFKYNLALQVDRFVPGAGKYIDNLDLSKAKSIAEMQTMAKKALPLNARMNKGVLMSIDNMGQTADQVGQSLPFKQGAVPKTAIIKKSDPLVQEAKKYKTAEEFVKALDEGRAGLYVDYTPIKRLLESNTGSDTLVKAGLKPNDIITVYRGIDDLTGKIKRKINVGDYVATSRELAESYTGNPKDVVSLKIKVKDFYTDISEYTKNDIKNGVENAHLEGVYNPNKPITNSQLIDIWNKANKK